MGDGSRAQLSWTIRRRFVDYVHEVEGDIRVSPPAITDGGLFLFPGSVAGDRWRFDGSVVFVAYGGMLSVTIAQPHIDWSGNDGELTVNTAVSGASRRVKIADLHAQDPTERGVATPILTAAGARLLGDVYPVGDALDPIDVIAQGG